MAHDCTSAPVIEPLQAEAPQPGGWPAAVAEADIHRLTGSGLRDCPAARLLDEHEPVYRAMMVENERCEYSGGATRRSELYEEQASWCRARSLRGAMYQVALAISRNDLIDSAAGPHTEDGETERGCDHKFIERLLLSVLDVLLVHVGGDLPDMLDAYTGAASYRRVELLSDDPPPFKASAFVERFEQAGGKLRYLSGVDSGLIVIGPPDPIVRTALLAEMSHPAAHEAVLCYVHERYATYVNRHGREPA